MTVYQTDFRPAWVDPIPEPRIQIQRMMLATATCVDGFVDTNPGRIQPYLRGTYLMPDAHILLAGTLCRRPVVMREFADVCRAADLDGIIVRLLDERVSVPTFDVKQAGNDRMLCVYWLWIRQPGGVAWLVPTAGENGPYVRLDPLGLGFVDQPPFDDDVDRHRGCRFGTEFMAVATQGWF
jgi:hypothetical protein